MFIIGGGPSILTTQLDMLRDYKAAGGYRIVGVNKAFRLGDWVDAVFFGDQKFYHKFRKEMIEAYSGLRVSTVPKCERDKFFKYIGKDRQKKHGISTKKDMVCWNKNSGCASINLAYHFGANRIILLGFDMSPMPETTGAKKESQQSTRTHWHEGYPEFSRPSKGVDGKGPTKLPYHRYLGTIPTIAKDAKELGVEIIDCSMRGRLTAWTKRPVEEVIKAIIAERRKGGGGC